MSEEERKEWRALRALVLRARVPAADADDVTLEVMLAVRGAEKRLVVPEGKSAEQARLAFRAGILRRQVLRFWHGREEWERARAVAELEGKRDGMRRVPSAEELALAAEERAVCLELLRQVPVARRVVWVAYHVEGRAMEEIAADLGIRCNTAWNRLRLARGDLEAARRRRRAQELREGTRGDGHAKVGVGAKSGAGAKVRNIDELWEERRARRSEGGSRRGARAPGAPRS